jgi:diguanylate cyclase (GGDEF)-like protein
MEKSESHRFANHYLWFVVFIGALVACWAVLNLATTPVDLGFILLSAMTVIISSQLAVRIPRVGTNITVSDTFVFLAILLYGGAPAVLLAAAEGLSSGFRAGKRPITILFNSGVMACSTLITVSVVEWTFGTLGQPAHGNSLLLILCLMALAQYVANTALVGIGLALRSNQPVWQTWHKHYLWTSITYFAGAAGAGVVLHFVANWGLFALAAVVPVIAIVYFTYYKYLEDLRVTSLEAENAEHARAEAERKRAEQAELHVAELSRHIAEQERISRALEETKEHFRHAAFHDALTDLPNRALLTEHIKLALGRPRHAGASIFAVLFLDLDRFKNINDSLGHIAGDQLLIATARALESCMRPTDTVARLGGDEFAILLDGLDDEAHAITVAERIQQALTRPFNLIGHEVYITASIGITLNNGNYTDAENVLRDADTAMYRAKEGGKARCEVFDSTMHSHAVALLKLENDLRRAIERNEFQVYYQPIICLETNELYGFESLVRWNHPERGLVLPDTFIPIAEETGLILEMGQQVLYESCRQMREWHLSMLGKPLSISVNLSAKQFAQPDLIDVVSRILDDTGLEAKYVKLEITESVVMKNAEIATEMLMQLCALGVQLSIDDFGTGYSSLSYLHRFPVSTLKIDRSFIGRMGQGGENAEIVRTINTLAQNLGMEVVAEGVETLDQLLELKSMKCSLGQGYLFSRPMDAQSASTFIQDHRTYAHSALISDGFSDGLIQSQLDLLN